MILYKEDVLTPEILNGLRESVGWRLFSEMQAALAVRNTLYHAVALDEEHPVAMGRVVGDGVAYLSLVDMAVLPVYQGRGIGREIVRRLLERIWAGMEPNGVPRIAVNIVSAPGRERFYKGLGFADIQKDKTGTGMQMILTRRENGESE